MKIQEKIYHTLSYSAPASAVKISLYFMASSAILSRPVAFKYFTILSLKGNTDVVAPISAPILQIVPIPVAEIESTPGPKHRKIHVILIKQLQMFSSFKMREYCEMTLIHINTI